MAVVLSVRIEYLDFAAWSELLPDEGYSVFHQPEVLRVIDEHATSDVQLLGGFRGAEPVALLPVFIRRLKFVKIISSPSPGLSVPWIGPILLSKISKPRTQEMTNREFTEAVFELLDIDTPFILFRMLCCPSYTDPRPYIWADLEVAPRFTLRIDLEDRSEEEVLMSFSGDVRSEIRTGEALDVEIKVRGVDAAARIYDDYSDRYEELGMNLPTSREFTCDLVTALDHRARAYVAETPEGEFLGGILVLYSNDGAFSWQGGMRAEYEGVSVNSLLDWRVIEDILTDPALSSVKWYDLGNANIDRLSHYKSKYNPELVRYYEVNSGKLITLAKLIYNYNFR